MLTYYIYICIYIYIYITYIYRDVIYNVMVFTRKARNSFFLKKKVAMVFD